MEALLENFQDVPLLRALPNQRISGLFLDGVEGLSDSCEKLLLDLCPEIVSAAKSVSDNVTFVPVAAVGWMSKLTKPRDCRNFVRPAPPFGVVIPLLLLLHKNIPKVCLAARRANSDSTLG